MTPFCQESWDPMVVVVCVQTNLPRRVSLKWANGYLVTGMSIKESAIFNAIRVGSSNC